MDLSRRLNDFRQAEPPSGGSAFLFRGFILRAGRNFFLFCLRRPHFFHAKEMGERTRLGADFGIAPSALTNLSCFACSRRAASLRLGLKTEPLRSSSVFRPRFSPPALLTTAQHFALTNFPLRTPDYESAALGCSVLFPAWGNTTVSASDPLALRVYCVSAFRSNKLACPGAVGDGMAVLPPQARPGAVVETFGALPKIKERQRAGEVQTVSLPLRRSVSLISKGLGRKEVLRNLGF